MNAGNQQLPHYAGPEETKGLVNTQAANEQSLAPVLPNAFFSAQDPLARQGPGLQPSYQQSPQQIVRKERSSDPAVHTSAEATSGLALPFGLSFGVKLGHSIGAAISSKKKKNERHSNAV